MLSSLRSVRAALEAAARDFDPSSCSGQDAIAFVAELGVIRRLTDGIIAKSLKRVEDTAAYVRPGDRNAAELCTRVAGRVRCGAGPARGSGGAVEAPACVEVVSDVALT